MFIYNTQNNLNPFGFSDINESSTAIKNIQPKAAKRITSRKSCSKKKLSKENIAFLKALGLKVKNH